MDLRTDEHGEVTLDPSMPADVQQNPASQRRWQMCAEYASQMVGKPAEDPEVAFLAREIYESPIPTDGPDGPPDDIQEARRRRPHVPGQLEFERLHPRGRAGEWIDKPDMPEPPRAPREPPPPDVEPIHLRHPEPPKSPGVTLAEIEAAGLNKWPEPSQAALDMLGGKKTTADRYYLPGSPGTEDNHPPYAHARRAVHDLAVGRALAGLPTPGGDESDPKPHGVATLLGMDHPIVQKLAEGGLLTDDEKQTVRDAADAARGANKPEALFMAGGTAAGKTTVLRNNPELLPDNYVYIDPDDLKHYLPEYAKLRELGDHYAALAVHLESGDIAERVAREAQDLHLSSVHDGTGNSGIGEFKNKLERKRAAGYSVRVVYATMPTDDAVSSAVRRAEETGRFVPVPRIRELHSTVSKVFTQDIEPLKWLSELDVFDRDHGHIGSLHNGVFYDLNPEAMDAFRAKASEQ